MSRGTNRSHSVHSLRDDEVREKDGAYILVRIGEDQGEHVKLTLGRHAFVLTISIDDVWDYRVSLPVTDLLAVIQAETHRIGH